ncbi:MAG: HAMP domain-containing histidine kinase [Parcubacteria group bacterium]|nr:HAMP domain-containing histidine kinase [Parcubacteria group bacterium]
MVKSVKPKRSQVMLFAIGVLFFSFSFSGSNLIGSIASLVNPDNPDNWKILQYGLFGMPVFMAFLVYMIVKFRAFSVKLIGAQALVVSLVIVIGSEFFFIQNSTNQILVAITLILTGFIGLNLIHSVKKEIEQREKIEMLAEQLKSLVHFISHEVKGALGKGRAVFGGILEGDYGDVPVEVKDIVKVADKDTKKAVDMVMNILSSSDLKNGKMKMDMKPFDMKTSVLEIVSDLKADAEEKGLSVETNIPEGADFTVVGDQDQIAKHVVRNLIDNSIRYTPTGGLKVALLRTDGRVIFSFKDTGVGITPEDKTHLFTEGGRGKDSVKVNVSSTGYGLYFAKGIVEANGGKIWVESEGQGKGSTFFVEFPAKK